VVKCLRETQGRRSRAFVETISRNAEDSRAAPAFNLFGKIGTPEVCKRSILYTQRWWHMLTIYLPCSNDQSQDDLSEKAGILPPCQGELLLAQQQHTDEVYKCCTVHAPSHAFSLWTITTSAWSALVPASIPLQSHIWWTPCQHYQNNVLAAGCEQSILYCSCWWCLNANHQKQHDQQPGHPLLQSLQGKIH